ncbi:MAG: hypothetical protein MJ214_01835 [Bacilli bacterium]|nr:hypothetical protein [Bacilli bacterium]
MEEKIRDFYGHVLGSIVTETNGVAKARDFYGHVLGTYDPRDNKTRDFYNRVVSSGNTLASLIMSANNKNH